MSIPQSKACGSWVSDVTGLDANAARGTITFGGPRPDRIPMMLQNLPKDTVTFFLNPAGNALAFAIRQAKEQARQHCVPMPQQVITQLSAFFPLDLFSGVCWAVVANGTTLDAFAIHDGGMAAITLEDVVVFRSSQDGYSAVLWSHELTHVLQYRRLGVEAFAAIYSSGGSDALEQEARNFDQFVAARLQTNSNARYWQTTNGWSVNQQITSQQYVAAARQVIQSWHGVDLDFYCKNKNYRGVALVENNAYGWKCIGLDGSRLAIDMFDVCRWQYRGGFPRPLFTDFANANSWTCTASQ